VSARALLLCAAGFAAAFAIVCAHYVWTTSGLQARQFFAGLGCLVAAFAAGGLLLSAPGARP
jgi:hypothetical protein